MHGRKWAEKGTINNKDVPENHCFFSILPNCEDSLLLIGYFAVIYRKVIEFIRSFFNINNPPFSIKGVQRLDGSRQIENTVIYRKSPVILFV